VVKSRLSRTIRCQRSPWPDGILKVYTLYLRRLTPMCSAISWSWPIAINRAGKNGTWLFRMKVGRVKSRMSRLKATGSVKNTAAYLPTSMMPPCPIGNRLDQPLVMLSDTARIVLIPKSSISQKPGNNLSVYLMSSWLLASARP